MAIAISGDFGEGKSAENFKRWIASGGGKFVSTLTEETTHLICTESDWKKKTSTGNVTLLASGKLWPYNANSNAPSERSNQNEYN